ncbi:flavin reductase family protein [Acidomonas methanolica]|uniref:flavin reductase family protein n=1 Tax=Acidomonas methanolica TaxID=437 RepID=UPI00277B5456|nr:flavin reductase family protein [Acidomonas methanolica]MCQ9156302.1 flavin reductase [Acidomonas methanolica]
MISSRFGGSGLGIAEHFASCAWSTLATGAPVLEDSAASFDCVVTQNAEIGTHTVLFCEVRRAPGARLREMIRRASVRAT